MSALFCSGLGIVKEVHRLEYVINSFPLRGWNVPPLARRVQLKIKQYLYPVKPSAETLNMICMF